MNNYQLLYEVHTDPPWYTFGSYPTYGDTIVGMYELIQEKGEELKSLMITVGYRVEEVWKRDETGQWKVVGLPEEPKMNAVQMVHNGRE